MTKPINPHWLKARARAEHDEVRFGHVHLNHPAIARKNKPLPPELASDDELLSQPEIKVLGLRYDRAIYLCLVLAMVCLLFVGP